MKGKTEDTTIAYGRAILAHEAEAILSLSRSLDERFHHAVSMLLDLPPNGRVIVSGVGKAGFIAQKISATFASIGIPSFFLHPAEAIHGDLGRYSEGDIALVFSKSGETPEIVRVLPAIKRFGCPLISVTGNDRSSLGRHSDAVLALGELSESGPLGLAPTTSTTAMLAVGDALAMAVLDRRGISKEQFAALHPGGHLGHSLKLVSEVMRQGDSHCVVPETMLTREVLHRITITRGRPGASAIVGADGTLSGVYTDGDLRRCLDKRSNFLEAPISELMTRTPKVVKPGQLVEEALRVMTQFKIDQLIVVDDQQRPVGLVDIQDLVEVRS